MKIIFGTYTKRDSEGIYTASFNQGILSDLVLKFPLMNPTYFAIQDHSLFAVSQKDKQGGIACYEAGVFVNEVLQDGSTPCFVDYVKDKKLVLSANYHLGNIISYAYTPKKGIRLIQKIEYGPSSHAHYIKYFKQLDEVLVCDLGLNREVAYSVDPYLMLHPKYTFSAKEGQGPRHLIVHPMKPIIYVFAELSSELLILVHDGFGLRQVQCLSTLPANEQDLRSGAAIRIDQKGKFIYVSNRGHDSISVFKLDETGKKAEMIQNIKTEGDHPRDFNLSPDGKYCVVVHKDSDNAVVFTIDHFTGKLTLLSKDYSVPEAVCVEFVQEV
jgi:6-phosphogluconolactonase